MNAGFTAKLVDHETKHSPVSGEKLKMFLLKVREISRKPNEAFFNRLHVLAWVDIKKLFVLINDKTHCNVLNFVLKFESNGLNHFAGIVELTFVNSAHVPEVKSKLVRDDNLQMLC